MHALHGTATVDVQAASALDHAAIRRLLPHGSAMCLLERVRAWDAARIVCTATGHCALDHPLRRNGRLRAAAGLEYAAQAMALHGALLRTDERPRRGYLASVRDLQVIVPALDAVEAPLEIEATRIAGDARGALYAFALRAEGHELLAGRASVVLEV